MNAINPSLFRSLLASLRALPEDQHDALEHVVRELSAHLVPDAARQQPLPCVDRVALSPWQERRAKELMSSQMDKGLSIARIASECSLSRSHFSRAFKKTPGFLRVTGTCRCVWTRPEACSAIPG